MAASGISSAQSSALRNAEIATKQKEKLAKQLSSGVKSFSDDAAGAAIALQLSNNSQIAAVAARNISDGVSTADIADGALGQISEITGRMQELAMQSSSGTISNEQRAALDQEYQGLKQEIDRISATTEFNGQQLLTGESSISVQGTDSLTTLSIASASSSSLGVPNDIASQASAQGALDSLRDSANAINQRRADLGAFTSRLEEQFTYAKTTEITSTQAASRITDVDYAAASAESVAARIRTQAAYSVAASSNKLQENILQLLR